MTDVERSVHPQDSMCGSYLGPRYKDAEITAQLDAKFHSYEDEPLYQELAELIANGKVVDWFQGCMELDPRALSDDSMRRKIDGSTSSYREQVSENKSNSLDKPY